MSQDPQDAAVVPLRSNEEHALLLVTTLTEQLKGAAELWKAVAAAVRSGDQNEQERLTAALGPLHAATQETLTRLKRFRAAGCP